MRSMKYFAGLFLGFAAIVSAHGEENKPVLIHLSPNPTPAQIERGTKDQHVYTGDYTYQPGTVEERVNTITVKRKFKYFFPGAELLGTDQAGKPVRDSENNVILKPKSGSSIVEYVNPKMIRSYLTDSRIPAYFKNYLRNKNFRENGWVLDCRDVAKRMVETLIYHRMQVEEHKKSAFERPKFDKESRFYQQRENLSDIPFIAKHLDSITIRPAEESKENPKGLPWYTCDTTVVEGEEARCGNLQITYKPVEPDAEGAHAGQSTAYFDPFKCVAFSSYMTFQSCELLSQVTACGLRNIQKQWTPYVGKPAKEGLSDQLERFSEEEQKARREGTYVARPSESTDQSVSPYVPFALPTKADAPK